MNGKTGADAVSPQAVCAACGFASPAQFRYCGGCGAALGAGAPRAASDALAAARPEAERRQLTVLFCDLVGSSTLSTRLDPEELRDLILSYQEASTAVIRRFGGTISRYVGDGIRALFGFPLAHEDDAERAVQAGLDVVRAVAAISLPSNAEQLAVRIGVATGVVVVGDVIGQGVAEEEAVLGETPNLAARLQALGSPNSVVISAGTRALVRDRFECADLGAQALHGFADPVPAWRVLAARAGWGRFDTRKVAPLVGREEHLAALLTSWREVEQSRGRVVLLAGEAGIGKSRVVEALRENLPRGSYLGARFQCSPHYVNTALHPIIENMQRAAGIGGEDTPALKLTKLSAWVGRVGEARDAVALFGALLSIDADARYPLPAMSPPRQKELTFELLLQYLMGLAAVQPVLAVMEDLHWVDPTTAEFLSLLVERVRDKRVMVVLTFRPDFSPPWAGQPHVESRELERLEPRLAARLAEQVAGERLPKGMIEHVVARTDGVPLFIEELTRAVVDTGLLAEEQRSAVLRAPLPSMAVPATLRDSLMARLDQLGPAKLIAQVAGAIGREFSYELLQAVLPLLPGRLRDGLQVLEQAGMVYADPRSPAFEYIFKHALVQDVAYQSLLRSRRRELHLRIAEALENRFPQTARDRPELVAHHWTAAGNAGRAVAGWLAAGRRASERSEYREAIGHLRTGLALTPQLADPEAKRESELALLLALAPALITTEGGGAPEVSELYKRALDLCEGTPESATHFTAHWGWWRASMDLRLGSERADRMFALAQNLGEPALLLQAHHCQWATLYMRGAHDACCRHIETGLKLYQPERDRAYAVLYGGHDARVCALGELALARWLLGRPREALEHVNSALAWARELGHVGSRAHAMDYALVLHKFRRDVQVVAACADELVSFASEQQLRDHHAKGLFFRGWARAMLEDPAGGLADMTGAMDAFKGVGTPEDVSLYYEMLAEIYIREGRYEEALKAVDDAFKQTEECGILFWNPELHRRRGELLLASSGEAAAAAACFQEALDCARAQGAKSLELRAAASLARLHKKEGRAREAAAVLRPVCESLADADTLDVLEARALLEAAG